MRARDAALRIVLTYLAAGAAWILLGDWIVDLLSRNPGSVTWIRNIKDGIFLCLTSSIIYVMVRQALHKQGALREEVESSETQLVEILNQVPIGILIAEPTEGRLVFGNMAAEKLLGVAIPQNATSRDYSEFYTGLHPDGTPYKSDEWPLVRSIRSEEWVTNEEVVVVRPDGERRPVYISSAPTYDRDGKLSAGVVAVVDISERKKAAEELARSEERLRLVVSATHDGVYDWNLVTDEVWRNERYEALFGRPIPHIEWWRSRIHGEDRERLTSLLQEKFKRRDSSWAEEYRMLRFGGQYADVRDRGTIIYDDQGKPVRMLGALSDITDLKRAMNGTLKSLSLLEATLEATKDALLVIDLRGHISRVNERFLEMWGLRAGQICEDMPVAVLSEAFALLKDPEKAGARVREIAASEQGETYDLLEFKDGRFVECASRPQCMEGRVVGRVWSFRDVTERHRMEQIKENLLAQEREYREEAERSVRLRDDFLAIASHELRTPLTPIRMHLQLVRRHLGREAGEDGVPKERLIESIDAAEAQFERFLRLVGTLLDVSTISAGGLTLQKVAVDLSRRVETIVARHADELARNRCELVAEIEPGIEAVLDPARFDRVVSSLLANAIKYGARHPVEVALSRDLARGEAVLVVRDFGIGIRDEDQAKLFRRFERVASVRNFGGFGLGLYMVRMIVEAHGGSIQVQSAPGKGSSFTVRVPLGKDIGPAAGAEGPSAPPA